MQLYHQEPRNAERESVDTILTLDQRRKHNSIAILYLLCSYFIS
jgi:hypothetical protein